MEYKEDLRIVRTRKLLSNTLLDMMEEESLEKISVIDLCSRAMVNRATFYAHFEDKYHLLSFALEELKDEIYSRFSKDMEMVSPKETLRNLAYMAFEFVQDNENHVANILKFNRNEKVISTIKDSFTQSVKYQLGKFRTSCPLRVPLSVVSICFTGALVDLCLWYVDNPDRHTAAEIREFADIIIDDYLK